jgi:hypothetical protein
MKKLAENILQITLIVGFGLIFNLNSFSCTELPQLEPSNTWEIFRKTFPFHIQTIAFDKQASTLLIAEPPPHVNLADLKIRVPELTQIEEKQHTMGCDGWVKDLVIQVPSMDESKRQDLFDRLNLYIFNTTYKANVMDLPAAKSVFNNADTPLDITVTFADLKDWLVDRNETFESVLTGEQIQFTSILSAKKNGVYSGVDAGLVVWAIDRKKPLTNSLAEARQFALDSDLIVGAVSNPNMLTIVGRKRIVSVDILPPIRTETILQLAAVKNPDLGQSYERLYVFAGRFNETDDWAPIYLSDELIDTEYGSLLNITDQILKRWSMKGTINYKNFESYNDPNEFPFKDKTLVQYLNNAEEVTFNWNTFGLGYSAEANGNRVFAVNRTGALPTSYLSKEQNNFSDAEEIGYKYFAEAGDSNLARVVQYAALYQIFQDTKVTAGKDAFSFEKYTPNFDELYREFSKIINEIKSPDFGVAYSNNKELVDAIATIRNFGNKSEFKATALSILDPRNLNGQFNKRLDSYYEKEKKLTSDYNSIVSSINSKNSQIVETNQEAKISYNAGYGPLCYGKRYVRGTAEQIRCSRLEIQVEAYSVNIANLVNEERQLQTKKSTIEVQLSNLSREFGVFVGFSKALRLVSKKFIDISDSNRLKDVYLRSLPVRNSKWIHTPSIVVSTNDDFFSIGGTNLNSRISGFRSGNVPKGKVKILNEGGKQIFITNPSDASKVSSVVRTAGKRSTSADINKLKKDLEAKLNSQPVVKPKPKLEALKSTTQISPSIRTEKIGWFPRNRVQAIEDEFITITKSADGGETIAYQNREVIAFSPTSRNDYLSSIRYGGREPAIIRLIGDYKLDEARALKSSMVIKKTNIDEPPSLIKLIKNRNEIRLAKDFDFASAKIYEPQFEVIRSGNKAQTSVSIDIEVPSSSASNTGSLLKVKSLFGGLFTRIRLKIVF